MKKYCALLGVLLITICFFSGCGKQGAEQNKYSDVFADSDVLFADMETNYYSLGMQFLKGEPVQLLSKRESDENGDAYLKVLLRRADNSTEVLLEKVDTKYRYNWYLDEDGCYYLFTDGCGVTKLDREGREVYTSGAGETVVNISRLSNGRLLLLAKDSGIYKLAQLDTEKGTITKLDHILIGTGQVTLGGIENDALLLDEEGITRINLQNGEKTSVMSFLGTSYNIDTALHSVKAFYASEDGNAEILWSDGKLDSISVESIEDRIVLTMRYWNSGGDDWLRNQIVAFNQTNDAYYVMLDERGENNTSGDFKTQTNIQLATGKGADIIGGSAVDLPYELIEKGTFENLAPYMTSAGIKEEDFFPAAFQGWRRGEEIYGINMGLSVFGEYAIDAAWLTDGELPTVEELLDRMLASEEQMYFFQGRSSQYILRYFLEGSEDFWGILDWENGTCDFSGELFDKLLEVAKRYSYSKDNRTTALLTQWKCFDLWEYEQEEQLQKEGRVGLGFCFDDGWHPCAETADIMSINAASGHKEGAWEFISYLLSEEVQVQMTWVDHSYPVSRNAYAALAEREIADGFAKKVDKGTVYKGGIDNRELTTEIAEEFAERLEEAESVPIRTEALLDIVLEEANHYFSGEKSKEEVIQVIENRVGLYMKEHK